jgi:hypothetical protein
VFRFPHFVVQKPLIYNFAVLDLYVVHDPVTLWPASYGNEDIRTRLCLVLPCNLYSIGEASQPGVRACEPAETHPSR